MSKLFQFKSKERKILQALVDLLIPKTEKLPFCCEDLQLVDSLERSLQCCQATMQQSFRLGLKWLEWGGLLRFLKPFLKLQPLQQEKVVQSFYYSHFYPKKILFRLLEAKIISQYYSQKKVEEALGFYLKKPRIPASPALHSENVLLHSDKDLSLDCEVCVIGSGAGAAPLAAELSAQGLKVVILEEGGRYDLNDFKEPIGKRISQMWRESGLFAALGLPPVLLPFGRSVGGTTTINSGTCFRLPDKVIQKWNSQYDLKDISSEGLRPYFEKIESILHVTPVPEHLLGNSARIIQRGFQKMGMQGKPLLRNVINCEGSGVCTLGCPTDAKQSVQLNFIPQALQQGARLLAQCRVEEIVHEKGKVREVRAQFVDPLTAEKGAMVKVKAKVFVLAAGSIFSPVLLKKSKLNLAEVGKNLTLHPAGKAFALFEEEVRGWEGVPQSYYCEDYNDQGIMFEGIFTPPIGGPSILLMGLEHKTVMEQFDHLACFGFMISDDTRGSVYLGPKDYPMVLYNLIKSDVKKFIQGTRLLCRLFFEAGAKEVYTPFHPMPVLKSRADLEIFEKLEVTKKDMEVLAFHPLGTCRMGTEAEDSVVNSFGKVHEMDNLFISDGSIFPTSLGVNPQMTIMAFSLRIADYIKKNI
ncbi:MAG: GMC family oxidoreductase N-terminal domain-containing protein [Deltaproteobacteria bacterium]|nr:GMC family oxidoreductase N-terminal domain-containing protein [Deltaproteobacteria bacterium]